ncbi:MAG: hypothetical protein O2931_11645 [Planctomycetota bacterium]|nr:hypothetical protein [Planctomycetota bacterium]MDA1179439.1 hypothetical protein [Planctomycetota bacterium]
MLVLLVLGGLASGLRAETSPTTRQLIAELGHQEFQVRQRATQQLAKFGLAAFTELEAAQSHADPEVRQRAGYILATVQKTQQHERLSRLRKGEPISDDELPGWKLYVSVAGDSAASRELFAAILQYEWGMIAAALKQPAKADEIVRERVSRLRVVSGEVESLDVSALIAATMLLNCDETIQLHYLALEKVIALIQGVPLRLSSDSDDPLRRLLTASLIRAHDRQTAVDFLVLGLRCGIPETMSLARTILLPVANQKPVEAIDVNSIRVAMNTVRRFGTVEHVEWLQPHFADERPCFPHRAQIQVRDLALVTAIDVIKEDPAKFGLPGQRGTRAEQADLFATDADRSRAFELWQEAWATRAANKK